MTPSSRFDTPHRLTKEWRNVEQNIKRIALLGTGDEIINGDILNTNAQHIAQSLIQNDMQPGNHMVASDEEHDLQSAMHYLLEHHDALITIGGLGPTSDDLTRFAIAKVVDQSLKFDDDSWQGIVDRLTHFNLDIPESNKQQCLFPQGATILENDNGTANGCKLQIQGKVIYMLPGPPNECLPLFKKHVLPDLIERDFSADIYRKTWLLLGVSEGSVADTLEKIVKDTDVDIGYRVDYPYLEVKCYSTDKNAIDIVTVDILKAVGDKVISETRQTASEQLLHWIKNHSLKISWHDPITGGRLEQLLHCPDTDNQVCFHQHDEADVDITLQGFSCYWQKNDKIDMDHITVAIKYKNDTLTQQLKIPYRGKRMPPMACESICWTVYNELSRMFADDSESLHPTE